MDETTSNTNVDAIKELRAEYVRIGYLIRDTYMAPITRNRKSSRQIRIDMIKGYMAQQDAIWARIVELQEASVS